MLPENQSPMSLTDQKKLKEYLTFFNRDAKIEHEGQFYTPSEEDFAH